MDRLRAQVARAQRRLILQQFLAALVWALFVTLLIAVGAVAVPMIWAMPIDTAVWNWSWIGGALAAATLGAVIWTVIWHRTGLDAAIEIDRRYGLKERVSSTLALDQDEIDSDMGRALVDDAVRRVERIDVRERFRVKGHWTNLLPILPAIAVFLLMALGNPATRSEQEADAAFISTQKQIKNSTEKLKEKLAERRKKAEQAGLKDAEDLFKKIEAGVSELNRRDEADRKKAMAKLNDLAEELKKRRQELGSPDQVRNQLDSLKNIKPGPAAKMAKAIKDGDFAEALDELKKLQDQLRDESLSDQQRAALAGQLNEMAEKLQQMADAHEQAKKDLQQQIEKRLANGDRDGARKLQEKLNQLKLQNDKMDRLRQMANQLGQCAQSAGSGQGQQAAAQLGELAGVLEQMQTEMDELEMLEDAMAQIGECKGAMSCGNCNGLGCGL